MAKEESPITLQRKPELKHIPSVYILIHSVSTSFCIDMHLSSIRNRYQFSLEHRNASVSTMLGTGTVFKFQRS